MAEDDHPYFYLPLAVPGVIVGGLLAFVAGSLFVHKLTPTTASPSGPKMSIVEGPIRAADWVGSAAPDGPRGFLRIEIEGAPRSFIVAASSVSDRYHRAFDRPQPLRQSPRSPIPTLRGRTATIAVDSSYATASASALPYMSGLSIDGEVIVPHPGRGTDSESQGWRATLLVLFGSGTVLGLCIFGVSLHHILICVRFWKQTAE